MMKQNYIIVEKEDFKIIENTLVFSFSGGGWLGLCYYLGILEYIYKSELINYNFICLGASAGSWASLMLLYLKYNKTIQKFPFITIKQKLYDFIINLEDTFFGIPINSKDKIIKFCNEFIQDELFISFLKDKLFISISEFGFFYVQNIITCPLNKDALITNLIDSSKLPVMITFKDFKRFDGSFTNNQPLLQTFSDLNYKIIKINCIYKYNSDITISEFINPIYICKKPSIEIINKLIKLGNKDMKHYKLKYL